MLFCASVLPTAVQNLEQSAKPYSFPCPLSRSRAGPPSVLCCSVQVSSPLLCKTRNNQFSLKALQFFLSLSLGRVLPQSYVMCKCPPRCCAKLGTISKALQFSLSLSLGRVLPQSCVVPVSVLPTPGPKPDSLSTAWVWGAVYSTRNVDCMLVSTWQLILGWCPSAFLELRGRADTMWTHTWLPPPAPPPPTPNSMCYV